MWKFLLAVGQLGHANNFVGARLTKTNHRVITNYMKGKMMLTAPAAKKHFHLLMLSGNYLKNALS
jgi:hypothetical protein